MKAIIVCVVLLLIVMGIVYEAIEANGINASLPKKRDLSSVANPPPSVKVKGKKIEIGDAVNFLKSYPVNEIESGMVDSRNFIYRKLPQIPLEKWLASVMGDATLEWKQDECAEYDSNIDDNDKHCASFLVSVRTPKWRCPEINLSFDVGTDGTVYFLNDNSGVHDFGARGGMQQIADLERTLAEVKAKTTPNRPSSLPAASLKAMSDNDMIMHVQALDVHSLDLSLPSERFDKWLERTARWSMQWRQASALEEYHARCEPKRLAIRAYPTDLYDPKSRRPPADIQVDIGSWEQGIEGEPKLQIYFKGPSDSNVSTWILKDLSTLQKKFDEWNAALKNADAWNADLLARKSTMGIPINIPTEQKVPVAQNMTKLGDYSRIRSTPSGHCYGLDLSLWQYGKQVFGTLFDPGGQCADSQEPTYVVRDAKYDPATGKIEFWSYGTPGYKFVGKMDEKMITGQFIGMTDLFDEKEVILKRSMGYFDSLPETDDSNKNVELWCKEYAPNLRLIEKEALKKLCKSLGVQ